MSKIRSSNTKPERLLKSALKGSYLRYQPKVYGKPDFASKVKKVAIFVDGCFWHKCPICYRQPQSNTGYWISKVEYNTHRDKKIVRILRKKGWKVCRVWEHEVRTNSKQIANKMSQILHLRSHT